MNEIDKKNPIPVIAIVGRPNVGKSSLFNAILGRRLAIVHEMSGVTRDRVSVTITRGGRRFTLIDTGGLGRLDGEEKNIDVWDTGIAKQVAAAIGDADVLIFVGDAQAGITPLDMDVAARLRVSGKPVIMAANKCDCDGLKNDGAEFAQLGFGTVYPICCTHREGIMGLMDAALSKVPAVTGTGEAETPKLRIAIVGRPNVGKSSLVNALTDSDRMMTGPVAGTTRDAVDVDFTIEIKNNKIPVRLVDTAGLRKAAKVDNLVEYFSVQRAKSALQRCDLAIFVVEAGEDCITAQDRKIAGMIGAAGCACVIAVNKIDRCPRLSAKNLEMELRKGVPHLGFAPSVFISALQHQKLETLLAQIVLVAEQLEKPISTGILNRIIADATTVSPPPVIGSSPLKIYYATMTGKRPQKVTLFVNNPKLGADHYLTFLKKRIRDAFGLSGIPIDMELRSRPKKVESIRKHKN